MNINTILVPFFIYEKSLKILRLGFKYATTDYLSVAYLKHKTGKDTEN
jgi:hypothetical protein